MVTPNTQALLRLLVIFIYDTFKNPEREERKGSKKDKSLLESTFSKLGHKTVIFQNLNYDDTFIKLKEIQSWCNRGDIHMINFVFSSHGDGQDPDSFLTTDDQSVSMNTVHNMFRNANCPGLRGKPKIFWAIFCRNIREARPDALAQTSSTTVPEMHKQTNQPDKQSLETGEAGHDPDVDKFFQMAFLDTKFINIFPKILGNCSSKKEIDVKKGLNLPTGDGTNDLEDMTTIYSCRPEDTSYRHPRKGTVMVQSLCEVLDKYGKTHPFHELYYQLQANMKARDTPEYKFRPYKDDLMLKTCFFAGPI